MATKIPIAQQRMFANVYVCKNCNKKVRAPSVRVVAGKISCPRCKSRAFRPIRKK
jgi:DNA-directed RNA polymerase subunit RPC12/RpoP